MIYFKPVLSLSVLSICILKSMSVYSVPSAAPLSPAAAQVSQASNTEHKIQQFMEEQSTQLSTTFPYRINLYTEGQINQTKAGTRISERGDQLLSDNFGMFFYYNLVNRAMRVPHWHANATEVGTVVSGKMKITIWEGVGKKKTFTVEKDGTWTIPQATLHALENAGTGELTFFVAYNSPITADRDFVTAWASLPDAFLEQSLGLNKDEIKDVKTVHIDRLSSFDAAAVPEKTDINSPYSSSFATIAPIYHSDLGSIRRIDSNASAKAQAITLQQTVLKPGTLRLPHWYTAGDTLLFIYKGTGFFTMMNDTGQVYNVMVKPGDLISLPVGTFHSYLNTGRDDLVVYETFNVAKDVEEISLLEGTKQFNTGTISGASGLSKESVERIISQPVKHYMTSF